MEPTLSAHLNNKEVVNAVINGYIKSGQVTDILNYGSLLIGIL